MKIYGFILTGLLLLAATPSFSSEKYDLSCTFEGSKRHAVQFRLNGYYEVNEDGSATLDVTRGLTFDDPELMVIEVYQTKDAIDNDADYKPRGAVWKDHVRFELKSIGEPMFAGSGGNAQLLIALKPTSQKKKKITGVPNPGTEITSTFHAGLQYYSSDVGDRTEVSCKGLQYISDRTGE